MTAAISDYALIGDCRSAALVSRHGSIDWLCWPRFDSPSLFGALLDPRAGAWAIAPTVTSAACRAYVPATNIVRTRLYAAGGVIDVTDFMPVASEADKRHHFHADHEITRIVECIAGDTDVEMRFEPRPGYGGRPLRLVDLGALGIRVDTRRGVCFLRTDVPATLTDDGVFARVRMHAGDTFYASLVFSDEGPAVLPPLGLASRAALDRSIAWWQAWAARIRYAGPFADAVVRSALTVKLLGYAPSGAVVAAPTTSLPERPGGDLNWDYRYCWLRDA
jgi:GH15 family glucan-1,4-alpha-glucosidase